MPTAPTIYDVAAAAGVGIATVSRVLNGATGVREDKRLAVRSVMAELGYRPSRAARRLASGGVNRPRVAVLLPFFSAAYYFAVARALARDLALAEIDCVIHDIASREDKHRVFDRLIEERGCEAMVLASCAVGGERQDLLRRIGVPAVCIDRRVDGLPCAWIDNHDGIRRAIQHLHERGAKRLGFIGGPDPALALRERAEAFAQLQPQAPRIEARALEEPAGRVAALDLLAEHPDIDGLVCANDLLAIGALSALRTLGRSVPDSVLVIGFDDQPLMDVLDLTTIRQPMGRLGRWGAEAVLQLLRDPAAIVTSRQMPLTLIARGSTAR